MRGQGRVFKRGETWWLDYSIRGERFREPSGTSNKTTALKMLGAKVEARRTRKLMGEPEKVRLAEYQPGVDGQDRLVGGLLALVQQSYERKGNRSLKRLQQAFAHIVHHFGVTARASDLTTLTIGAYESARLGAGAARATVAYEKAQIRQAFKLAVEAQLLATGPIIKTPKIQNARSGFFSHGDMAALSLELSPILHPLIRFLYLTGWRCDEGRLLTWDAVDWDSACLRLPGGRSKNGRPRVFPFRRQPELKALMEARWKAREGLCVFHDGGQPIGYGKLRSGWVRATKRAGLTGRLVHDLRRTFARDMRRDGVAESDIQDLGGWLTRETFLRYAITDEAGLEAAAGKRFASRTDTTPAQSEVPADSPQDVS